VVPEFDYRDVLLKASEIVSEEGRWVQKMFFRSARNGQSMGLEGVIKRGRQDEVGVCAVGAIQLSAELMGAPARLATKARTAVEMMLGRELTIYNDAEGRTADEVADALRRAAE
jgi:hypothetical protein